MTAWLIIALVVAVVLLPPAAVYVAIARRSQMHPPTPVCARAERGQQWEPTAALPPVFDKIEPQTPSPSARMGGAR